jgi:hypothetical protein
MGAHDRPDEGGSDNHEVSRLPLLIGSTLGKCRAADF